MIRARCRSLPLLLVLCWSGRAGAVSSNDLLNNADADDGKTVVYAGEIIGELIPRGKHVWLNVNDGDNAIGVWAEKGAAGDGVLAGNYERTGDKVSVEGKFNRSCREHGGDLDIHAVSVTKLAPGGEIPHVVSRRTKAYVLILSGMLFLIALPRIIQLRMGSEKRRPR